MGIINGKVQTSKVNDFGFTSYKIDGTWYGADAKGPAKAAEGDQVTFEAFNKQDKKNPDKFYPTIKVSTLTKVSNNGQASTQATGTPPSHRGNSNTQSAGTGTTRDTYWADKAKSDSDKDPRIAYFASSERAIQFVDLAIRNGAFKALEKAKDTAKLEILEAFVNEQTNRIMAESYAAKVPEAGPKYADRAGPEGHPAEPLELAFDESWS